MQVTKAVAIPAARPSGLSRQSEILMQHEKKKSREKIISFRADRTYRSSCPNFEEAGGSRDTAQGIWRRFLLGGCICNRERTVGTSSKTRCAKAGCTRDS